MAETTTVWVKTSALDVAIHGTTRKHAVRGLPDDADREDSSDDTDWGWAIASVLHMDDSNLEVYIKDEESAHNGVTVKLPSQSLKEGSVVMANKYGNADDEYEEENLDLFPDDLITLTHLNEPEVVYCLRQRYRLDKIYTATGPILLALNPFKNCKGLYAEKVMKEYWLRGERAMATGSSSVNNHDDKLPPHVYGIADSSFRTMMRHMNDDGAASASEKRRGKANSCDQSILVSGESGAGKTVTTKFIMQYLAKLSQRSHAEQDAAIAGGVEETEKTVEQQVLQSNPILESFGNARTIRNDNSSRFGKFIEIKFSNTGTLMGASIETYLLEKVRLVHQAEGERNFHIFYELFCMEDADQEEFCLQNYTIDHFNMTSMSETFDRRDGIEDYDTYDELRLAMETMGMSDVEQHDVLSVPCAALHGSNVSFLATTADESALDLENEHLEPFIKLMGITSEALDKALCYLNIKAGKEFHTRTLSKTKAEKGMEALIKGTYGALFTFLVQRINSSITVKDESLGGRGRRPPSGGSRVAAATICVLDIFGFESFTTNSFEQLCINYCNEALQQQFNLFVLKNEQEEYEREGIAWSFISFPNNQDCLELIDKKGTGILRILDDQCRAPGTTDKTFYGDLYKKCIKHPRFSANKLQEGALLFCVNHYAGPVEYNTEGFVQKNRDELPKETTDLLLSSEKEIIRKLAHIISDSNSASISSPDGAKKKPSSSTRGGSAGTRVTVGGQFSTQLKHLSFRINLTSPHYVRCLKPNDMLVPDHFDPLIVSDQLRYAGVIEAVRVSRVGYPQRYTHKAFVARYRVLGGREMKKAARRKQKPVDVLVNAVSPKLWKWQQEEDAMSCKKGEEEKKGIDDDPISLVSVGIQIGKTKVFLQRRAYEVLEQLRRGKMAESSVKIQTIARGYIDRRDYQETRSSVILVQCIVRTKIAKGRVREARHHHRATVIQTAWRKGVAHHHFTVMLCMAKWIQRVQRGRNGRRRYEDLNRRRKAIVIQKNWRMFHCFKLFRAQKKAALTLQCAVRCRFARVKFKQLRLSARDLNAATQERDDLRKETQKLRQQLKEATAMIEAEALCSSASELSELKERIEELTQDVDRWKGELEESQQLAKQERERRETAVTAVDEAKSASAASKAESELLKQQLQDTERERDEARVEVSEKDAEILAFVAKLKYAEETVKERAASNNEHEHAREQVDEVMKELESTKVKAAEVSASMETLIRENDELRVELETSKKAVANAAALKDLELDGTEIEKLKQQLAAAASARATSSSGELEVAWNDSEEMKRREVPGLDLTAEEVKEQKQKLGGAEIHTPWKERPDDATSVTALETVTEAAAEEILTLQDEVARLNMELKEARLAISNSNSTEMLTQRCDELVETGRGNDKKFVNFKGESERFTEEPSRLGGLKDRSEAEKLQQEIVNLRTQLDSYEKKDVKASNGMNTSKGGFFGSFFGTAAGPSEGETHEQSEHDLQAQVSALTQVNELLRQEVESSRKKVNEVTFELREEKERSAMELEAFAESLHGVDELRRAAESMSRELNRIRRDQEIQGHYRLGGDEGTAALEEANMILASARADFTTRSESENKSPQIRSVADHLMSNVRNTMSKKSQDEYDIDPPYLKHKKDKKKRKKKRRGSGSSAVSSFF